LHTHSCTPYSLYVTLNPTCTWLIRNPAVYSQHTGSGHDNDDMYMTFATHVLYNTQAPTLRATSCLYLLPPIPWLAPYPPSTISRNCPPAQPTARPPRRPSKRHVAAAAHNIRAAAGGGGGGGGGGGDDSGGDGGPSHADKGHKSSGRKHHHHRPHSRNRRSGSLEGVGDPQQQALGEYSDRHRVAWQGCMSFLVEYVWVWVFGLQGECVCSVSVYQMRGGGAGAADSPASMSWKLQCPIVRQPIKHRCRF
jgi:hypothetical protein